MSHRPLEARLFTVPVERRIAKRRDYRNLSLVTPNQELSCESVKYHSIYHKSVMSALGHKRPFRPSLAERLLSGAKRTSDLLTAGTKKPGTGPGSRFFVAGA